MAIGGVMEGGLEVFFGGLHWQAAAYAFWDSLFCVGMVLGLTALFRRRFYRQERLTGFAADNTFGVYVFHSPLMVLISMLLKDWPAYPLLKFAVGPYCWRCRSASSVAARSAGCRSCAGCAPEDRLRVRTPRSRVPCAVFRAPRTLD